VLVAASTIGPIGVDVERADAEPAARAALGIAAVPRAGAAPPRGSSVHGASSEHRDSSEHGDRPAHGTWSAHGGTAALRARAADAPGAGSRTAAAPWPTGTDPVRTWVRTWTRTEALLKAAGTGLAVDPRSVRVSDAEGRPIVAGDPPPPPPGSRWWLQDLDLGPAHVAALALARPI
jgi:hypothetical protein